MNNAGDVDIAMPMYNLLEYSENYFMTLGNLWNYYKDEVNDDANENDNYRINNNKTTTCKRFELKTKIIGKNDNRLDAAVVVLLKYLSNFQISLNFSMIICKVELDLSQPNSCSGLQSRYKSACSGCGATEITGTVFQMNNTKLYVLIVTFSINNNINFLESERISGTISWNKYKSERQQFG